VPLGTTVYYCYAISNTGNVDLTSYDLEDNELGVLISGFAFVLGPGQSFDTVDAGLTFSAAINTTTTNTAVVTAQVDGGGSVFSTAQATVQVGGGSTSAPAPIPTLSVPALALLLLLFAGIGIHRIPRLSRDVSPMTRSH
jgi:hypothetical protein